jgi:hypothetical protein
MGCDGVVISEKRVWQRELKEMMFSFNSSWLTESAFTSLPHHNAICILST